MQVIFKHWLQANWRNGSAAFELKRTTTDRFYIPDIKEHQINALRQSFDGTLYYKIPDDSYGVKPMDCFVLQGALAYIVIGFGARLTEFYLIPIHQWEQLTKGKTSITRTEVAHCEDVECVQITKKSAS